MPEIKLRPYQLQAVDAIEHEWDEGRTKTLLVLPTGCGKTIVFAKICARCVERGERVLVLAHRGELLEQAADKLKAATGLVPAVEKADQTSADSIAMVVVGSVQTLMRPKRQKALGADSFDAIIIDEAHHALSESYRSILTYFDKAKVLGVTATPDRGDHKDLGEVFDSLAYEYSLPEAIRSGYLCPIEAQTIPLHLDLNGVGVTAGDFKADDLGHVLEPYLEQIADEMIKVGCKDRKTVVFLPLIATSQKFCDILNSHGFRAAEVNGMSNDRSEVLEAFSAGRYNVLCNSMLLTEGWDCPSVDCIIVLRPTKVRSLYCQMVGRGTRLSPETGKGKLLILDFLWHTDRHELCRPAHIIAKDADVAKAITQRLTAAATAIDPEALDLQELERQAETEAVQKREESLAKQLEEQRKKKARLVDPLQYEMSIQDKDLSSYVPKFMWEMAPPSAAQIKAIEAYGVSAENIESSGKASLLLDRLSKRRHEGMATPKEIKLLERYGFVRVGEWQEIQARALISRIAASGWKIPKALGKPAEYKPQKIEMQM